MYQVVTRDVEAGAGRTLLEFARAMSPSTQSSTMDMIEEGDSDEPPPV